MAAWMNCVVKQLVTFGWKSRMRHRSYRDTFHATIQEATAQMLKMFYQYVKRCATEKLELNTTLDTVEERKKEFLRKQSEATVIVRFLQTKTLDAPLNAV